MQSRSFSRTERVGIGSVALTLALALAALMLAPATALGQGTGTTTPVATPSAEASPSAQASPSGQASPTAQATTATAASLSLSSTSGPGATSITANGLGFQPNETVDVTFNGQPVGQPTVNSGGSFSLSFNVPNLNPADYGVLAKGRASNATASATFTIKPGGATLTFIPTQAAPGASVQVTGMGFQPGESVELSFNGPVVGTQQADTSGQVKFTFSPPATLAAGQYGATATGDTSKVVVNTTYTLVAGPTPVATTAPEATATPAPAPTAAPAPLPAPVAPTLTHDDRYFSQTGFRIDNDDVWSFFNQYGGIGTFGYPTSRMMTFLGCPVQMFQRQIIQVCPSQGAALINMLDPEIFPYTRVNGSTFPGPDPTLKNNTPQVGSPTYAQDINDFVTKNVPDTFGGQSVNFLQHFNSTGGLTIWGAPISLPAADPANGNFIYQRFQRGIMHYIAGTGTESILLADYLKAIIMAQNVPPDLLGQSRESRYYTQYCPGNSAWLCRPNDLPGTDLTFAFEKG